MRPRGGTSTSAAPWPKPEPPARALRRTSKRGSESRKRVTPTSIPSRSIRAELSSRFAERFFEWTPYLYSWRLDDALEPLERRLIAEGAINATGLWYVGDRL